MRVGILETLGRFWRRCATVSGMSYYRFVNSSLSGSADSLFIGTSSGKARLPISPESCETPSSNPASPFRLALFLSSAMPSSSVATVLSTNHNWACECSTTPMSSSPDTLFRATHSRSCAASTTPTTSPPWPTHVKPWSQIVPEPAMTVFGMRGILRSQLQTHMYLTGHTKSNQHDTHDTVKRDN